MSILIKGMEMPTEEYGSMTITIYPNGSVMEYIGDIGRSLGNAVPVPPHGDLIDRDEAVRDLRMDYAYAAARIVALRPVIIPADRPKEEAPATDTNVPTYDLLYEEGGYNSNGV